MGLLDQLGQAAAGMMGGGGLMGLASQLSSAGLGMMEMQTVGKELFAFAREPAHEPVRHGTRHHRLDQSANRVAAWPLARFHHMAEAA